VYTLHFGSFITKLNYLSKIDYTDLPVNLDNIIQFTTMSHKVFCKIFQSTLIQ